MTSIDLYLYQHLEIFAMVACWLPIVAIAWLTRKERNHHDD